MNWITTKKAKKAYKEALRAAKGFSGLERAEKIFQTLSKLDECTYNRWNFKNDMQKNTTAISVKDSVSVTVLRNMIANIDENFMVKGE